MIDYTIIGGRLKQARRERHLTQEKLAEQLEVSVPFLSRIERGDSAINLKRLCQICNILGITEGQILNGVTSESETYLNNEFSELLKTTSPKKQKLIYTIAVIIVEDSNISKKEQVHFPF